MPQEVPKNLTMIPKKYTLLKNDTVTYNGKTLYRIQALRDGKRFKTGQKGGYIESEDNLSQLGECWIGHYGNSCQDAPEKPHTCSDRKYGYACGNSLVTDDAYVNKGGLEDNARLYGNSTLDNYAKLTENAEVVDSTIENNVIISGNAKISNSRVSNNCNVSGSARILENSRVSNNCKIYDNAVVRNSTISTNSKLYNNAYVCNSTVSTNCEIYDNAVVVNKSSVSTNSFVFNNSLIDNSVVMNNSKVHGCSKVVNSNIYNNVNVYSYINISDSEVNLRHNEIRNGKNIQQYFFDKYYGAVINHSNLRNAVKVSADKKLLIIDSTVEINVKVSDNARIINSTLRESVETLDSVVIIDSEIEKPIKIFENAKIINTKIKSGFHNEIYGNSFIINCTFGNNGGLLIYGNANCVNSSVDNSNIEVFENSTLQNFHAIQVRPPFKAYGNSTISDAPLFNGGVYVHGNAYVSGGNMGGNVPNSNIESVIHITGGNITGGDMCGIITIRGNSNISGGKFVGAYEQENSSGKTEVFAGNLIVENANIRDGNILGIAKICENATISGGTVSGKPYSQNNTTKGMDDYIKYVVVGGITVSNGFIDYPIYGY